MEDGGEKCDLYDHGMVIRAKWDGLSILEQADLLGVLHTTVCGVSKEWCEEKKHSVSGSSVCENALWLREVRDDWLD